MSSDAVKHGYNRTKKSYGIYHCKTYSVNSITDLTYYFYVILHIAIWTSYKFLDWIIIMIYFKNENSKNFEYCLKIPIAHEIFLLKIFLKI